ncbi:hypothetical protein SDC9_206077 [bioreactor metagenome]|uniref:Uncharacterized protein n=1 Tax=bioreactor metagenome TaxID=1076179 RepID=A0A645J5G2_9ZZZZ
MDRFLDKKPVRFVFVSVPALIVYITVGYIVIGLYMLHFPDFTGIDDFLRKINNMCHFERERNGHGSGIFLACFFQLNNILHGG